MVRARQARTVSQRKKAGAPPHARNRTHDNRLATFRRRRRTCVVRRCVTALRRRVALDARVLRYQAASAGGGT
jgi:hypothetical protein